MSADNRLRWGRLWAYFAVISPMLLGVVLPYAAPALTGASDVHPATVLALAACVTELTLFRTRARIELARSRTVIVVAAACVALILATNLFASGSLDFAYVANVFLAPLAYFFVVCSIGRALPEVIRASMLVFLALVAIQLPLALAQVITGEPLLWADALGRYEWLETMLSENRAVGTLDHPLVLALLGVVGIAVVPVVQRALARWVIIGVLIFVVALTQSRFGLALAGLVVLAIFIFDERERRRRGLVIVGAATLVAMVAVSPLGQLILGRFLDDQGSNDRRLASLEYFVQLLPEHLLTGNGTGASLQLTQAAGMRASFENPMLMLIIDAGLPIAVAWYAIQWLLAFGVGRDTWRGLLGARVLTLLPAVSAMLFIQIFSSTGVPSAAALLVWTTLAWANVSQEPIGRSRFGRTVMVWRNDLLPGSETFIRNQFSAINRRQAILAGVKRRASPLAHEDDVVIFGESVWERVCRKSFLVTGWSNRLDAVLERSEVGVIHAHFGPSAATIYRTAKRNGVPLVITVHGFDVSNHELRRGLRGARYRWRVKRALAYATNVVAVSQFIADELHSNFDSDPAKTLILPIGIPTSNPAPASTGAEWDLIFVGRLVEKKGVSDLLAALSLLREGGHTPSVAVVGDGPLREQLELEATQKELDVRFLGSLSPAEVSTALTRSRVFVGPSKTADSGDAEGFGMVFLEAALAALPTVAYRHGGVPEAVEDGVTGLLADEGDIAGLANHLADLLRDQKRAASLGRAGRERVVERFSVDERTRALEDVYDAIVEEVEVVDGANGS